MAAGLGFKTFAVGEVLSAANVNGYLMQGVLVFASAAARDAAITSPQEGQFAYLKDTNVTTYYTGSAWANLDTTGMTNPMTTTGDTIYSSSGSTPARLGIGTAGQVLQVNSGATAPEWATPAGGGGANWSLLNAGGTSLSGAQTITVSGISGKDKIMVFFQNASSASASSYTALQLNTDTGSNYGYFGSEYGLKTTWNANAFTAINSTTQTQFFLAGANGAGDTMSGYAIISGANASGIKIIQGSGIGNGGNDNNGYNLGGFYSGSSTISSISLKSLVGNWDGGTVYVYTSA